ncbi:hypothetical protein AQUCO_05400034v1 [Aquilegia coerulea]|uniref:Dof zinc finger protein n=1 Tax=Aquilegia coerulea TaxID=218851 RepID=A0A2G5CH95_AQUCA|nr:hypothetical protein AQUCO_05400034v1 [Aquilegia coerulea]
MGLNSKQFSNKRDDLKLKKEDQNQQKEPLLNCPWCDSMNTKFCYFNNYNRSQPRYYCKSCKRYWTKGGNLRNVPIGGNRRNKPLKTINSNSSSIGFEENGLLSNGVAEKLNVLSGSLGNGVSDSSPLSLPFSLPNLDFTNLTSFETTPSAISPSSAHLDGEIQGCRGGIDGSVEDPCSSSTSTFVEIKPSLQLSSSNSFMDSWSWDDFNTIIFTDMNQTWEYFEGKD